MKEEIQKALGTWESENFFKKIKSFLKCVFKTTGS